LTDEHSDDNTQQALIHIADGATVLRRYDGDVRKLLDRAKSAATPAENAEYLSRAIATAQIYDKELDRWLLMVTSALSDIERRLRSARTLIKWAERLEKMPKATNPAPSPPISHGPSKV
jgi:hypothetical protein